MFPASSVTSAAPPSAAPADIRSFCERVNVVMPFSQKSEDEKSAEPEIQRTAR